MSRSKKRKLVAIGSLALVCLTVLFSCLRERDSRAVEERPMVLARHKFPVQALAFGPDGATLTSAACYLRATHSGLEVAAWDVGTGHPVRPCIEYPDAPICLAFDRGGRALAAAGQDRSLWVWETAGPKSWRRLGEHGADVFALAFSNDGGQRATADLEGGVTLWDVGSDRSRAWCKANVSALAFAPDGKALARGEADCTIRLWDVATGAERAVLRGHTDFVVAVAFGPDGRTLATGDHHGVVKLWDVASRTERATLAASEDEGFPDEVSGLSFAPQSGTLAVAVGCVVQLWDVGTSSRVARLEGHEGTVRCLAYAPDGTLLASGGHDRAVRLWDMTRYQLRTP
jgi:WD40 repeat protein